MKRLIVLFTTFSLIFSSGTIYGAEVSGNWFMRIFKGNPVSEPLSYYPESANNFRVYLRSLWEDQVKWTKSYIVSVMTDIDDASVLEDKIIKN